MERFIDLHAALLLQQSSPRGTLWFGMFVHSPGGRSRKPLFLRGGGVENLFAYCRHWVGVWTWVLNKIFLVYGPPNP